MDRSVSKALSEISAPREVPWRTGPHLGRLPRVKVGRLACITRGDLEPWGLQPCRQEDEKCPAATLGSSCHPSTDIPHHPPERGDGGSTMIPEGGGEHHPSPTPPRAQGDVGCRIISSATLLDRCRERLKDAGKGQLWGLNLRAGAVTLFVGETSVGKTVFLHNLAYHLARGKDFLGISPPRPLRVLSVDFESYDEIYLEHLSIIGTADGWDFFNLEGITPGPDFVSQLKKTVVEGRYDVLIVDPLTEAYPVKDENDNALANTQMLAFRTLARSTGAAVIVVHNSGQKKGKKTNPKFQARGATSRVDRADVGINFTWKSESERTLHVVKARGSNLNERFSLRFVEELGYELVESSAPSPSSIATLQAQTLEVLRDETARGNHEVERKTLMERLGVEKGNAREQALDRALAKLATTDRLRKVKKGVYALPSDKAGPTVPVSADEAWERSSAGEPEAASSELEVAYV